MRSTVKSASVRREQNYGEQQTDPGRHSRASGNDHHSSAALDESSHVSRFPNRRLELYAEFAAGSGLTVEAVVKSEVGAWIVRTLGRGGSQSTVEELLELTGHTQKESSTILRCLNQISTRRQRSRQQRTRRRRRRTAHKGSVPVHPKPDDPGMIGRPSLEHERVR